MKQSIKVVIFFLMLLFFTTSVTFADIVMPDLKGNWVTKSYSHHHEKRSFFVNTQPEGSWIIKEQQGRFFSGERIYVKKQEGNKKVTEGFSGAISRDGKRLYIADHEGDYLFGDILSNDSIEFIIMNDGAKNGEDSRVGIIEVIRSKK